MLKVEASSAGKRKLQSGKIDGSGAACGELLQDLGGLAGTSFSKGPGVVASRSGASRSRSVPSPFFVVSPACAYFPNYLLPGGLVRIIDPTNQTAAASRIVLSLIFFPRPPFFRVSLDHTQRDRPLHIITRHRWKSARLGAGLVPFITVPFHSTNFFSLLLHISFLESLRS